MILNPVYTGNRSVSNFVARFQWRCYYNSTSRVSTSGDESQASRRWFEPFRNLVQICGDFNLKIDQDWKCKSTDIFLQFILATKQEKNVQRRYNEFVTFQAVTETLVLPPVSPTIGQSRSEATFSVSDGMRWKVWTYLLTNLSTYLYLSTYCTHPPIYPPTLPTYPSTYTDEGLCPKRL